MTHKSQTLTPDILHFSPSKIAYQVRPTATEVTQTSDTPYRKANAHLSFVQTKNSADLCINHLSANICTVVTLCTKEARRRQLESVIGTVLESKVKVL